MSEINVDELLKQHREELEFLQGNWYVVRTRSNVENHIKDEILRRAANSEVEDLIYEVVVPMITKTSTRQGKVYSRETVRIPAYILVRMADDDDAFDVISGTNDVTGFLGQVKSGIANAKPIPISTDEVWSLLEDSLREQFTPEEDQKSSNVQKFEADSSFVVGDYVNIIDGPFASMDGKVTSIDEKNYKVSLVISIFGRDTPVELNFNQVSK